MSIKRLICALLFTVPAFGQNPLVGGQISIGGQLNINTTTVAPVGILATLFDSSWNHVPAGTWCPTDSLGNVSAVKSLRFWDSGQKWGQMETARGTYSSAFTTNMTNMVTSTTTGVANPGCLMDLLYTFGDTPAWAALGTDTKCATPTTSSCVPPSDIDSGTCTNAVTTGCGQGADTLFQEFVVHVVNTFPTILFYEGWNEPDGAGNFWSNATTFPNTVFVGSPAANTPPLKRFVRLMYDEYTLIHCLNPSAKVISPSFHGPTALTWMHNFVTTSLHVPSSTIGGCTIPAATVSGLQTFDITNAHLRGSPNNIPENFLTAYGNAMTEMNNDGLPNILWDDEFGPVNQSSPAQTPTVDILAYFSSVSYILRASVNTPSISRAYWYQFDSAAGTGVSALQGNIAGTAVDTVAGWLIGGNIPSVCSKVGTLWTCNGTTSGSAPFRIMWNTQTLNASLTNVSNASGGNTVYTCSSTCTGLAKEYITITGFGNSANNGSFTVSTSTAGTITVNNAGGVAQSGTATGSFQGATCGASCGTQSGVGFTTWTDILGNTTAISGGLVPVGLKPVFLQ